MDQDASSEIEDLAASYRLLDEQCRRLQAQKEEHLQQAISTYETDRAAGQDDIKKKELEVHELEAKYNEDLRVKREALQTALQREANRKRKHDAEIQHLNQQLTGLKRLKQSNLEPSVRPIHSWLARDQLLLLPQDWLPYILTLLHLLLPPHILAPSSNTMCHNRKNSKL